MYTIKNLLLLILLCCIKIGVAQIPPPPPPAYDSSKIDERIFTKVEEEAEFPGGGDAWRKFLTKNLNADVPSNHKAPSGMYPVVVKFIVGKDGSIRDIAAETNLGFGMEEEVIRIIGKSGKWKPAVQNGRTVNAYRRQPVTFAVIEEGFEIISKEPYTFVMGADNEITVTADKIKPEDLQVTISKGTIKQIAEGKFVVRVNSPGRVLIELYNTKKDKSIGTASFVVRPAGASGN